MKPSARPAVRAACASVEALESKRLFAFSFSPLGGILTYTATGVADSLTLTQGRSTVTVTTKTGLIATHTTTSVKLLKIDLLGGDDTLRAGDVLAPIQLRMSISGGDGHDRIETYGIGTTALTADTLRGDAGNDTISNFMGYSDIDGGAGSDTILGSDQGATVHDDDSYVPKDQFDKLANDSVTVANGSIVTVGTGNDTVKANNRSSLTTQLVDGKYDVKVTAGLTGDSATTHFYYGRDTVYGSTGPDLINYSPDLDPVQIYADAGDDVVNFTGAATVSAGAGNDAVVGYYANAANVDLGDGNDSLSFSANYNVNVTVAGGFGNDVIDAHASTDPASSIIVDDGFGDDSVIGTAGNDTLSSGTGRDTLLGGGGNDTLKLYQGGYASGDAGDDVITVSASLATNTGPVTTLLGGVGNDLLIGSVGPDLLAGEVGNDTMIGGDGNDTFRFGAVGRTAETDVVTDLVSTTSVDTLDFTDSASAVTVTLGSLTLAKQLNRTVLAGGNATSYLTFERAIGTKYNDVFYGNAATNVFTGGDGDDRFNVAGDPANKDTVIGGNGVDVLLGKDPADVIYTVP